MRRHDRRLPRPENPDSANGKLHERLIRPSGNELPSDLDDMGVPHVEPTYDAITVDLPLLKSEERPREKPKYEWREVPRAHEVIAIGDLHGNWEAFVKNGMFAGILRQEGSGETATVTWTGGNKHVVFLGDILADRFLDGPRILSAISSLREQAQKEGGDITLLAGNHDNWAISYLLDDDTGDGSIEHIIERASDTRAQSVGLFALFNYINIPPPYTLTTSKMMRQSASKTTLEDPEKKRALQAYIAKHPEIIAHYTQYQLITYKDDTLFVHCSPTSDMMDEVLSYADQHGGIEQAIAHINTVYQGHIRAKLANEQSPYAEEYKQLQGTFLATDNRVPYVDQGITDRLRAFGINTIVHGHDYRPNSAPSRLSAMHVVTADQWAFHTPSIAEETKRSVVTIATDGTLTVGAQHYVYRDAKKPQSAP